MGFHAIPVRTFEFSIKFIHKAKPKVAGIKTPVPTALNVD